MAVRLRHDVQKASYYVWFLGTEEAKGLRGPNIIIPVIPHLIKNSQKQEPLKVTLQISHKGIKIIQQSSKTFIPHSAITSSIQRGDVVACVLLLYNPTTKCPIHVHAYRCDSETTAEALHQQFQILINRPENQKRFEELESRLGLSHSSNSSNILNENKISSFLENKPVSSLCNDTKISIRKSEASEEFPLFPNSPSVKPKRDLFDSLAAELRAKLNGHGPPLLLPPRDYDTVHRSKGNLAAIELRRCQNSMIVGPTTTTTSSARQISSKGSSGIESDLAPSPDRNDEEEDNWSNEADNSVDAYKTPTMRQTLLKRYCEDIKKDQKNNNLSNVSPKNRYHKYNKFTNNDVATNWNIEDSFYSKFVKSAQKCWDSENNDHYNDKCEQNIEKENSKIQNKNENKYRGAQQKQHQQQQNIVYDETLKLEDEISGNDLIANEGQEYQEMYNTRNQFMQKYNGKTGNNYYSSSLEKDKHRQRSGNRYRSLAVTDNVYGQEHGRNPYKEPGSLPYRESIEEMLKSPIMRYKSFGENDCRTGKNIDGISKTDLQNKSHFRDNHLSLYPTEYDERAHIAEIRKNTRISYEFEDTVPTNVFFKTRFEDAKNNLRATEKQIMSSQNFNNFEYCNNNEHLDRDCEEQHIRRILRGPSRNNHTIDNQCGEKQPQSTTIVASKSLSNLVKGYRHSYAEAHPALPRSSGRVGLAAVNPF